MSFEKQREELAAHCKKLLGDGAVSTVVGFGESGVLGMCSPYIFSESVGADTLSWNNRCVPNLSGYLPGRQGKTAIAAKPCDARAVAGLVKENQLKREDVHIIGLACGGMVNENGAPLLACLDCKTNFPPIYDTLIDDPDVVKKSREDGARQPADTSPERFADEMKKCILCYSCRQACYGCYCTTCFMDRGEPNWQPATPDTGAKMLYHLGRAMHLAGRCVECGACENACASGVDIRYLISEVTGFVEDEYGYRAGMDPETEPAMLTYTAGDREVGFLGGDAHVK